MKTFKIVLGWSAITSIFFSTLPLCCEKDLYTMYSLFFCMEEDQLKRIVELIEADYAELRLHKKNKTFIEIRNRTVSNLTCEEFSGVGIRVLHDGMWGFSATSHLDFSSVKKAAEKAYRMATLPNVRASRSTLYPSEPVEGMFNPPIKIPLEKTPIDEKMTLFSELDNHVMNINKKIVTSHISYQELLDEKVVVTSDGSCVTVFSSRPHLHVGAVAKQNNTFSSAVESSGMCGGWEFLEKRNPFEMAETAALRALRLLRAEKPEAGQKTVILAPEIVGQLLHEAVGHAVEADAVLAGSAVTGKLGEFIAAPCVSLIDSGEHPASGWLPVDDEAVLCKKTVIIEKGILVSYLHSRETAAAMDAAPTGNARAWEYDVVPLIRMRNTYILPGDWDPQEIVEETAEGYLLRGATAGQGDTDGSFTFHVQEALEVNKGEVGKSLRGVVITGNSFDVLKSVNAVGNNFVFAMGATLCSKRQLAKVDGGGPTIRCTAFVGGT